MTDQPPELSLEFYDMLNRASEADLLQLHEFLQSLLDGLHKCDPGAQAQCETRAPSNVPVGQQAAETGWVEIKTINGHEYAYRRWYDGGVKRSRYLGRADRVLSRV